MTILSTGQIGDLVNRFRPVSASEMPTYVGGGKNFEHPVIDETFREIPLPMGRSYMKQTTIADANAGKFYYAWLDADDLERYAGAFRVVTKDDCEAASAKGVKIPDRYFNSQGVIYRDGALYCYCSWEFHAKLTKETEQNASLCLAALMPKEAASEKDASGRPMATVHHTKLESQFVETGDKTKKKG